MSLPDKSTTVRTVPSSVYDANAGNYAQGSQKTAVRETIEHPVVLAHPDTGRRGLFISSSALGPPVSPRGGQGHSGPSARARVVAELHNPVRLAAR
jgi:hypothetical protein